ncbi:MAG: 50S ribosomal protein L10 [Chloroflexi bacterium]|nr:50S ribosomal protein L10 [Chloroflexota bacterium]
MPTEKKIQAVADMTEWLNEATIVISADYSGLPVTDMTALRRALREQEVSLKVVKNNLAYIAAENAGKPELKEIIQGPSAIALGYGEPTDPAKALSQFIRETRLPIEIRGAVLDGRVLDSAQVEQLASLPSKDELVSQLLSRMQSPIAGLVNVLNGPIAGLARVLQGRIDQMEEQPAE